MAPPLNRASRPFGQEAVTTSILLGNLHCPSCVSTIREVLQEACADHIRWVSPNIVTSVVTVEHDADTSLRAMVTALADAGFDICGVTSSSGDDIVDLDFNAPSAQALTADPGIPSRPGTADAQSGGAHDNYGDENGEHEDEDEGKGKEHDITPTMPSSPKDAAGPSSSAWGLTPLVRWLSGPRVEPRRSFATPSKIAQAHLSNCEQCRQLQSAGISPLPLRKTEVGASKAKSEEATVSKGSSISNTTNNNNNTPSTSSSQTTAMDKSFVTVEHEDAPTSRPIWRASLAVGGMTCAVCVNAITDDLKKKDWVTKVTVNLISNSATVEFDDKDKESKIVEAIEDLGYDATIDSMVRVNPPKPKTALQQATGAGGDGADQELPERTVEVRIDGLYCEHCPDRISRSLAGFRRPSLEIITKPTPQRPIIKLKYVPEAPNFTIRHILAAIEASDSELSASIYHPPTLEERSKIIQAKHQRQIMYRVIFTGLVCIPTFIIGIVYMSLLPSTNSGRMYMMAPWASGISRSQIALFIMATPVYFFCADIFHVRAFKEVRALWRRNSRTPFLQRFYRFGSMNTLMSLGTTIAYVSSVSQMIAAAAHEAAETSDANFYFDSVIFLSFFLLCGRLIESYSKSRTGDAVEMLGRLRPTTAILVEESVAASREEKDVIESIETVQSITSTEHDMAPGTPTLRSAPDAANKSGRVVQADLLDFGDVVRILHGASPPADGVIVQGHTNFDESSLTGESRLVPKTVGDEVFSGTVNKDAPVLVRVTGASGTSMLDQIVAVVREGQTKRAPMEQIADLLTTYFVPVVTLVAISTWIIWLSLGLSGSIPGHFLDVSSGGWVAFSLQFAIAVFVVACPCGLGLAAPTAIFVAGGMAAKYGILAKGGGEAFEKASRIDCVVFDKTGTLTMGGEPTVTDSAVFTNGSDADEGQDQDSAISNGKKSDLLAALKAVEENSGHPIAKAIVTFCEASTHATGPGGRVDDLQEIPGRGMRAVFHSRAGNERSFEIMIGNEALMKDFSVAISDRVVALLQQWKTDAKSVALAAIRSLGAGAAAAAVGTGETGQPWTLAAALSVADPVRPEAAAILKVLQARGVLVYMLSGDNAVTAAAVARQIGIPADQVIAEVLPTEKAAKVQYLQASLQAHTSRFGRVAKPKNIADATQSESPDASSPNAAATGGRRAVVAMVGDGINDSPALTQADVGIAVGSGSDVAISSADFVLVQSNLQAVVTLLELSRVVFRRIAFNFGWALVYNVVAVPIAAGVLYPIRTATTNHVRLDPVWASLAMALSSISVVTSSLALRSRIPGVGFRPTVVKTPATST